MALSSMTSLPQQGRTGTKGHNTEGWAPEHMASGQNAKLQGFRKREVIPRHVAEPDEAKQILFAT